MHFYKNCQILKKLPPSGSYPWNLEIGPQARHQKSTLPQLFGSTKAFQNSLTRAGSTNDHRTAPLHGKGLGVDHGLPGGGDWAGVLPTQKLPT